MKEYLDILGLLAITLGVFGLAYAAARFVPSRMARAGKTRHLHVLERIVVGKDRQVAILQVGKQYFLAGITSQSVQIGPALDPETFALDAQPVSDGEAIPPPTFADMLRKAGFPLPGNGKDNRNDP